MCAVTIAFLARHGLGCGLGDFEISLLAAASLVPLLSGAIAGATGIPFGFIVPLVLHGFTLRRAAFDHAVANQTQRVAQA